MEPSISGAVTMDSNPIARVKVYGSQICCPAKREQGVTDDNGRFTLQHPGRVIHFYGEGIKPQAVVLDDFTKPIHVVLSPSSGNFLLPICGNLADGEKRIGWGDRGPQFIVKIREVNVKLGKPDVDYVVHSIKRKGGDESLALWFGPYAANLQPDDELFISSVSFTQREIVADRETVGLDSRGELRGGGEWRHTAVLGQGAAIYRNANPRDREFFDQIIDSICEVPYPTK